MAQAFRQQQLRLVAEPHAPVGQIRALVRKLMLEELFPGEVLEIRIIDPTLANAFIGQVRSRRSIATRGSRGSRPAL
jgi:hypothetical protein